MPTDTSFNDDFKLPDSAPNNSVSSDNGPRIFKIDTRQLNMTDAEQAEYVKKIAARFMSSKWNKVSDELYDIDWGNIHLNSCDVFIPQEPVVKEKFTLRLLFKTIIQELKRK